MQIDSDASALQAALVGEVHFSRTSPILRIFDEGLARAFYVDFLGFTWDWEHRFEDNSPLYAQVSRAGLTLHLSGHHGDASPGATVSVATHGVRRYQQALAAKGYSHARPGLQKQPWGLEMTVTDPFGNRLRFVEDGA
jgi:uncharacterized glyoxalase superfamily protein PhnB